MERTVKKPRVLGLVGVLFLRGVFTLYIAFTNIQAINQSPELYESWALLLYYLLGAMGVVLFISAVLIAMYKRLGLILGAGTSILDAVLAVLLFVAGYGIAPLGLVMTALILYYIFKYLRNEPEKSFFT